MEWIPAKAILQPSKPTDHYLRCDFNMNLYRGCSHGCIYCDSRSACYQIERFSDVRAKENALDLLERDMRARRKRGLIATGAMSDPYNPEEAVLELTRGALILADRFGFGVSITTKSPLVTRDIDVLTRIARHSSVAVHMTITTPDDALCRIIEPCVAASSERFRTIKELAGAGIFAGVLATPTLPFLTDSIADQRRMIHLAKEAGAKSFMTACGMTLRSGNREYYYAALDRHFPGLRERYETRYGQAYACGVPDADALWHFVQKECERNDLLCRFKDINDAVARQVGHQSSLF